MGISQEHPNGPAPTGTTYRLGGKGGQMALAWQNIWDQLDTEVWQDGTVLAEETATTHGIAAPTVRGLLRWMHREGVLDSTQMWVVGDRGPRIRTHYRLLGGADDLVVDVERDRLERPPAL